VSSVNDKSWRILIGTLRGVISPPSWDVDGRWCYRVWEHDELKYEEYVGSRDEAKKDITEKLKQICRERIELYQLFLDLNNK